MRSQRLGADVSADKVYRMQTAGLRGAQIFLDEASVTGTENAVMAAVLAPGETVIAQRGERATRPGSLPLTRRRSARRSKGSAPTSSASTVSSDCTAESGGSARTTSRSRASSASAAVTEGEVVIEDVVAEDLVAIWPAFDRLGVGWEVSGSSVRVPGKQELAIRDDIGGQIPKIEDGPWPAFPADLTSIALAVATQAEGTVLIFEKMFENRLFFVDKLVNMGARIILCDPHRAVVSGPARLYGEHMESPDIRAGMAMLIASLCAEGTSTIGNIGQIDRGYERIDERLRAVGAHIERTEIS